MDHCSSEPKPKRQNVCDLNSDSVLWLGILPFFVCLFVCLFVVVVDSKPGFGRAFLLL